MNSNNVTVGILSDSHGFLDPRIATTVNQCDYIVHAGDIFNAHVLEQLKPIKELIAVAGNNDYPAFWSNEEAEVVTALPSDDKLELPGGLLVVEHGHRLGNHPEHEQFRSDHTTARMIVYGHTHHRVIDKSAEPWVVNPGASGRTRTHGGPSCLVLHASVDEWKIETVLFAAE
ncbi:MAG: YfcE family phosphodiesterase [Gammaproteobacteria bacterium]|jgi:putative phosphoesterase|nr:YfcE family phosphodiesterase [Gammaproteobacteria bacterium]